MRLLVILLGLEFIYTIVSTSLLLLNMRKWSDSLFGTAGKGIALLYNVTVLLTSAFGFYAVYKKNTRYLEYLKTLFGIYVLTSLLQMILTTVVLMNSREAVIESCYRWVAFNPDDAPIQPDCPNAAVISMWVAFVTYLLCAILSFALYKTFDNIPSQIKVESPPPQFKVEDSLKETDCNIVKIEYPPESMDEQEGTIVNSDIVISVDGGESPALEQRRASRVSLAENKTNAEPWLLHENPFLQPNPNQYPRRPSQNSLLNPSFIDKRRPSQVPLIEKL